MKVFIFGAGASKGSQETYTPVVKAPLANELFDVTYDPSYSKYAKMVGLSIADLGGYNAEAQKVGNLEAWLTSKWNEYEKEKSILAKKHLGAMFGRITLYIWLLMENVSRTYDDQNVYRQFLNKLASERSEYGFISFNYDTLLDQALVEAGYDLSDTLTNYTNAGYIKPHGSVNWFLLKRTDDTPIGAERTPDIPHRLRMIANQMYLNGPLPFELQIFEPAHMDLRALTVFNSQRFNFQYAYPFILIPLTNKLYTHFMNMKEKVIANAQDLVREADDIYLIGYKASDDVIKDILTNTKYGSKLHVVGHGSSLAIQNTTLSWATHMTPGQIYKDGFLKFVEKYS